MSMPKRSDSWRWYAKQAAYEYPLLRTQVRDIQSMSITPKLTGMPAGGGERRTTEDAALRQLPAEDQRKFDAVAQALEVCKRLTSGPFRIKLIELVYFTKSHNLQGAALQIPCSVQTAWTWNNDFLLLVWSKLK